MQSDKVSTIAIDSGIATLTIDSPPVNALGQNVRAVILSAVDHANISDEIRALIICCAGRTFFAGADIREFGKPPLAPTLPDLIDAIEACKKPVIAAIHGTALGGGLEVAMGCHVRVAVASAKLGLPEVKLGLLPGAGGTQRLPRLVAVGKALEMMTAGAPIGAQDAKALGLVDDIAPEGELLVAARKMALAAIETPSLTRRTRELPQKINDVDSLDDFFAAFLKANKRKFSRLHAPEAIVDVVRYGCTHSFTEALAYERAKFMELQAGEQSSALRYVFFAERETAKVPGIDASTPRLPINHVGIIGAGTMGTGIAINFLLAGLPVALVERDAQALERGRLNIQATLEKNQASGRMSSQQCEQAISLLQTTQHIGALSNADLVIEAAYETMEVKKSIFAELDRICAANTILATNTSYLNIDDIAAITSRPENVIGLHFFSPANIMKLVEIVRGAKTQPSALATALDLAKRISKVPVVSGVCHGFIGNRMLAVRRNQADALILEGASPYAVDRVLEDFGMPMGPFRMSDLAGLDLGWSRETSTGSTVREKLCEIDRRGQKSGSGFYDYTDSRTALTSPVVEDIIAKFATEKGIVRRAIDDSEILDRLLFPMINEAAKILDEHIALRGSDIDVVWLNGYGWPAWRGGPLYWADHFGLDKIIDRLRIFEKTVGAEFAPSAFILKCASQQMKLHKYIVSHA
jgi:3-hydroxyacyl-CoA dehydrogenase